MTRLTPRIPRTGRNLALGIGLAVVLVLFCCGGVSVAYVYQAMQRQALAQAKGRGQMGQCGGQLVMVSQNIPAAGSLSKEQTHNAAIIVAVGQQMKVPPRGWVIAVATAMQESTLHNYGFLGAANDHDSLGLFQQRPSTGWGTPAQIMDPAYAARKFYQKLLTINGWQNLPLTVAAQRVQVSAFPDAYAKWESLSSDVVNILTGGGARAIGNTAELRCNTPRNIAASGWTDPVPGAQLSSGFRTASRPDHNGQDLAVPKGTPIFAASGGVVTVAKCDPATARTAPLGCNQDGGMTVSGCGWYVEITHAANVITRYCHMEHQPTVSVGETVRAGQQIGVVGDSGHSSGPHLHFEVHLNGDNSSAGAVDPVPFMRGKGAPLDSKA